MYIYSLADPDGNVRYIGKTTKLMRRYYNHIWEAKRNKSRKSHKRNWINSLLDKNCRPTIEIVEEIQENWELHEIYWIA